MKINDIPADDLLERMHAASSSATAADARVDDASARLSSVSGAVSSEASAPDIDPLHLEIKSLVSASLRKSEASPAEMRGQVIETIIDIRYGTAVSARERRDLVATLKEALVDDPGFKREVDRMLILAAEEISRG